MSTIRAKKAPTAEQLRKAMTKRIGEQFKLMMYTAVDDLRSSWERADNIADNAVYQTTENLKAAADDKMVVKELATVVPAVYEMLWVLSNGLISECNRAPFPAGFDPTAESIADLLEECLSDAVAPSLIRYINPAAFGPVLSAFADPAQHVQNSIRGLLTSLTTREILVAMIPKLFVEFMKTLAHSVATFVWYDIQCKQSFVVSRVDEGLISAILVSGGFPQEIVDRMYGGIAPKVKKAPKSKKPVEVSPTAAAEIDSLLNAQSDGPATDTTTPADTTADDTADLLAGLVAL